MSDSRSGSRDSTSSSAMETERRRLPSFAETFPEFRMLPPQGQSTQTPNANLNPLPPPIPRHHSISGPVGGGRPSSFEPAYSVGSARSYGSDEGSYLAIPPRQISPESPGQESAMSISSATSLRTSPRGITMQMQMSSANLPPIGRIMEPHPAAPAAAMDPPPHRQETPRQSSMDLGQRPGSYSQQGQRTEWYSSTTPSSTSEYLTSSSGYQTGQPPTPLGYEQFPPPSAPAPGSAPQYYSTRQQSVFGQSSMRYSSDSMRSDTLPSLLPRGSVSGAPNAYAPYPSQSVQMSSSYEQPSYLSSYPRTHSGSRSSPNMAYQYPQHQQPPYTTTAPAPNPGRHYSVADPFSQPTPYDTHGHPSTSKRRRGNLPKHVTHILKSWLNDHTRHPYPTEEEKVMLAERTGLSLNQISNWFINARRRILQPATASSAQAGGGGGQGGESGGGSASGGGVLDPGGQRVFEMRKPKGDEPPLHQL